MCGEVHSDIWANNFDPTSRCIVKDGIATRYLGMPESIMDEITVSDFELVDSKIVKRESPD